MKGRLNHIVLAIGLTVLGSCSALFGDKENQDTDAVKQQGAIDPTVVPQQVGYVPIYPYFAGFSNPLDVLVGYDELVYVVDDNGLTIMDLKGTKYQVLPIPGATDVVQDRRLHTYVAGRIELPRGPGGSMLNLPAVYHFINTARGNALCIDTLIHPDCDESRQTTQLDPVNDPLVRFTGLATLHDNSLYVARSGPKNDVNSFIRPDNGVLLYSPNGANTGYAAGLNPVASSLKSSVGISGISGFAGPPQREQGISTSKNFLLTLGDTSANLEYRVLLITVYDDPDLGTQYTESPEMLNFDVTKAYRFMYESFRFKKPEDCYIAPDNLQYMFVVDSQTDSLYIFTNQGFEGVNAPATSASRKQVIVSFGGQGSDGSGSGPFSFNDPCGVCYYKRMVYVADKKNNRICRFKLNTDLE